MISPGDGTDLSIRLDGDAGPATSGDEVLVSAMLSPVQTYKTNKKTLKNLIIVNKKIYRDLFLSDIVVPILSGTRACVGSCV